jgi:GT2 family glycosyltransferase
VEVEASSPVTADSPALDICIVSWRSRELLRQCLATVVGQPEVANVVVVDNASGDGTVGMVRHDFPQVELIANEENLGFAAANNQAIRATESPFLLLLNPDTEVQPGALRVILDTFAGDDRIGAVAPQLVLPDGSIQLSCRSFPDPYGIACELLILARLASVDQSTGRYRMRTWDHDTRRDVDQPMASALAFRRAALDEVGLFDEGFPLFFNDVDLCFRLREADWRIVFEPKAKVMHRHGQSTRQVRPAAIIESHRGLIQFYHKHYRRRVWLLPYLAVIAGAWLTMWPRAALAWLAERGR